MFVLRLGVPVAIMVLLSVVVSRHVRREEAREGATSQMATSRAEVKPETRKCWEVKGCAPEAVAKCAVSKRPDLPCWLARQLASGRLMRACEQCYMYQKGASAVAD
jgi:hypothetical protein